ncbi:MAG: hypothetical protein ACREEW_15120 [Caulobacteraceae bacterium]
MSKSVTISDDLALKLDARRELTGQTSLDDAAQAAIAESLAFDDVAIDANAGYSLEELRALIDEADRTGPAHPWVPGALSAEVRRPRAAGGPGSR